MAQGGLPVRIPLPSDMPTFVDFVRDVLGEIVDNRIELIPPRLRPHVMDAWAELNQRRTFEELRDRAASPAYGGKLEAAGLTGAQLKLKLEGIGLFFRRLGSRWTVAPLRKLLEFLDIIIRSLLDAVGAGSALEEFKSVIEKILGNSHGD